MKSYPICRFSFRLHFCPLESKGAELNATKLIAWFLRLSLESNDLDNMVIDLILSMLDRSSDPEMWGEHFIEKWSSFVLPELNAIEEWLLWASEEIEDHTTVDRTFVPQSCIC